VWRDLAVALRHAVMELEDQVPTNPNQLDRPEVAEYERKYQERQRRAREQQGLNGDTPQPSMSLQHLGPSSSSSSSRSQDGQGVFRQLSDKQGVIEVAELQQQQLMAVIRRVSRRHQVGAEQCVDIGVQEQQEPWLLQLQKRWQQAHIWQTWQRHQDHQVAYLLARSKAAASSSSGSSSGGSSNSSRTGVIERRHNQRSSNWSWAIAWLPLASSAAAAAASPQPGQD